MIADAGSILAFDDLDKRCASHFLSRQVAQRGRQRCLSLLGKCEGRRDDPCGKGRCERVAGDGSSSAMARCLSRRESRDECDEAAVLRVKAEGWAVLADAQVRDVDIEIYVCVTIYKTVYLFFIELH